MSDTPTTESPLNTKQLAITAIHRVLTRRGEVPAIAYHIGYGTETLASLIKAMSAFTGIPEDDLHDRYPSAAQPASPGCPFCHSGSLDVVPHDDTDYLHVTCENCGARGPKARTANKATDRWRGRSYC